MTQNRRILWNIIATYGRSLFALACGLFTSRWALMALGEVDYGLFGVVGGLAVFISFFNNLLAVAVGRFYAFSIGQAKVAGTHGEGLEVCRQWFNTALCIHTIVPLILITIGYPIGDYAVRQWLTIPPDRVEACLWVLRFVCCSCFVGMVSIPFNAMYTAKQYIAELTIYSFVTTSLNVIVLYYMVTHPGVWLAKYALWTCFLAITPQIIIAFRATFIFPECHFNIHYLWNRSRIKAIAYFAGWQCFGSLGTILRGQGLAILVNKYFGPSVNAAQAISNTLAGQCDTLSGCMIGAFAPAITDACGAKDEARMRALAYRACKFGALLILLFAIPLSIELEEVLRLWLVNPPEYVVGLCWCVLAMTFINKTAIGHMLAVNAKGKIAGYQAMLGTCLILTLPLAWLFVALGWGVYSIGYALVLTMAFCAWGRVWFARKLVGMSARYWLFHIMLPLVGVGLISGGIGLLPSLWMAPSFLRVCITTALTEVILLPLAWFVVLTPEERTYVLAGLQKIRNKILKKKAAA